MQRSRLAKVSFSLTPRGPFRLAAARENFGGWADLVGDADAMVMAFPIETDEWSSSAAVVVREFSSGVIEAQAVQRAYELPALPDAATLERIADAWRPYRMWCSVLLHLWLRSGEAGAFTPAGRTRRR